MPRVAYVDSTDVTRRWEVEVPAGTSVMRGALGAGVDGIIGECGGNAMCASCHIYVDAEWVPRLPEVDEIEDEMLEDTAAARRASSRLSCQVQMTDELDGLTVRMPVEQQ